MKGITAITAACLVTAGITAYSTGHDADAHIGPVVAPRTPVERVHVPFVSVTPHTQETASEGHIEASELTCLALNIYHEARGEDFHGQVAVGLVTRNRVLSSKFPNTYCAVVYEDRSGPALGGCQFSWYCDGKSDKPRNKQAWMLAQEIAYEVANGFVTDTTNGADHYYAPAKANPSWQSMMNYTISIGGHKFFKS